MRFHIVAAGVVLSLGALPALAQPTAQSASKDQWLYAWAASADTSRRGAFLVQFDLRDGSTTAGKISRVIPAGEGSYSTHHTEHLLQSDGLLYADDFGLGRTFIFDLRDAASPKLHASFTTAGPFGWPHSYVRLPSGNRLVTYQFQSSKFNLPPGGLAEVGTDGRIVRWVDATTPGVDDKEITPYSLEVIPSLDRAVTTTTSMIENTGVGLQVWRMSDLKLLHTLRIPADHPHGMHATDTTPHHLFPGEPRLLQDKKTVMLATFTCGLYTITAYETYKPRITPVYRFAGQDCAVPVVIGKYWLQTVPAEQAVVVLDVSDPAVPKEVSRYAFTGNVRPHWLGNDASGRRIVVNSGSKKDAALHLLIFDPSTGRLSRDEKTPRLDMSNVNVPGLGEVLAVPHGVVFGK